MKSAKAVVPTDNIMKWEEDDQNDSNPASPTKLGDTRQQAPSEQIAKKMDNIDRNQIFLEFRDKEGKEYNDSIVSNISTLKEKKEEIKETSELCQSLKTEMERFKALIQQKQETKNQDVWIEIFDWEIYFK